MDTEQVCHTKSVQVVENNGKQRDGEALMTKIMIAGCGRQPHTPVVGESGTALRLSLALRKPQIFAVGNMPDFLLQELCEVQTVKQHSESTRIVA